MKIGKILAGRSLLEWFLFVFFLILVWAAGYAMGSNISSSSRPTEEDFAPLERQFQRLMQQQDMMDPTPHDGFGPDYGP